MAHFRSLSSPWTSEFPIISYTWSLKKVLLSGKTSLLRSLWGRGGGGYHPVHTCKQSGFFTFHWHLACWLCCPPGWQLCMLWCITALYLYYMLISTHTNSHTKFNRTHLSASLEGRNSFICHGLCEAGWAIVWLNILLQKLPVNFTLDRMTLFIGGQSIKHD